MAKPVLPPKYVNVPAGPAYDPELPDGVFRTYVQLRGLAWGKDSLDDVTVKQIMEVTGKSRSTIYGHLGILRDRGWLLFNSAHYSRLTVVFSGSAYSDGEKEYFETVDKSVEKQSRFLDSLNEEVKELNTVIKQDLNSVKHHHPVNLNHLSAESVQKSGQVSENLDRSRLNGWHDVIDPPMEGLLERLGVFVSVWPSIAEKVRGGAWTLAQLKRLAEAILLDYGAEGGGIFVYRVQNNIREKSAEEVQEDNRAFFRQMAREQMEAVDG